MTNKEIFLVLAQAYLDNYNKSLAVDKALQPFSITLEDQAQPIVGAIEDVLVELSGNEYIIELILDLNKDGYVDFILADKNNKEEKVVCHSLAELWNFITA
jgi:hypothetical protein